MWLALHGHEFGPLAGIIPLPVDVVWLKTCHYTQQRGRGYQRKGKFKTLLFWSRPKTHLRFHWKYHFRLRLLLYRLLGARCIPYISPVLQHLFGAVITKNKNQVYD